MTGSSDSATGYLVRQRSFPEGLFHLVLFMPSLVMVGLQQSSMAAGLVLYLVALCLYFFVENSRRPWKFRPIIFRPFFLAAIIPLGFVFFHGWALSMR
jgi:hypothetical protein